MSNEKIEKEQLITKLPAIATIDNIPTSSTEGSLYVNASFTKIKKLFSGTWRTNFERYLTKRLEQQKLHQKTQDTSSSPDETQTRPRFPK